MPEGNCSSLGKVRGGHYEKTCNFAACYDIIVYSLRLSKSGLQAGYGLLDVCFQLSAGGNGSGAGALVPLPEVLQSRLITRKRNAGMIRRFFYFFLEKSSARDILPQKMD